MAAAELKLTRIDRIYHPGESVEGSLIITSPGFLNHTGIRLNIIGNITLQMSARAVNVFESLYSSIKPIQLFQKTLELRVAGRLMEGSNEVPFSFVLEQPKEGNHSELYETYHGAYVNIQYIITAEVQRGMLQKTLSSVCEFIVEGPRVARLVAMEKADVKFVLTPDTQKHALGSALRTGGFRISGTVPTRCLVSEPLLGDIIVDHSSVPIHSIDVKLMRVESVILGERMARESTEIQSTQIADGDICRGLSMPIYVILPRLFTCPTLTAGAFSVEFEVQIVVCFEGFQHKSSRGASYEASRQWMATETLPLLLNRA